MGERTTEDIQRDTGKMIGQTTAKANLIADALIDICKQSKEGKAIDDYHANAQTKQKKEKDDGKTD